MEDPMRSLVSNSEIKPESVQHLPEMESSAHFAQPLSLSIQVGRRQAISDQKTDSAKKGRDPRKFKVRQFNLEQLDKNCPHTEGAIPRRLQLETQSGNKRKDFHS